MPRHEPAVAGLAASGIATVNGEKGREASPPEVAHFRSVASVYFPSVQR